MKGFILIIAISVIFSQRVFTQCSSDSMTSLYRIVTVDSMPNHYLIFVSRNLLYSNLYTKPHLTIENECGSYSIESFKNQSLYCIISNRNDSLRRNINEGLVYKLTLDTTLYSTIQKVNTHLGFGDYLLQDPWMKICTANEIVSLFYNQEIDSNNKLSSWKTQNIFFDNSMLNIWLTLDKEQKDCYFIWLKTKKKTSNRISIKCKDECIELFDDPNCNMRRMKVKCSTQNSNGMIEAKLFFRYKRNGFIEINNAGNILYGWIRNL
jgi:hypothetical protein